MAIFCGNYLDSPPFDVTGSHGVVRYLELIAQGATAFGDAPAPMSDARAPPSPPAKRRRDVDAVVAAPVWKFAKLVPEV